MTMTMTFRFKFLKQKIVHCEVLECSMRQSWTKGLKTFILRSIDRKMCLCVVHSLLYSSHICKLALESIFSLLCGSLHGVLKSFKYLNALKLSSLITSEIFQLTQRYRYQFVGKLWSICEA